MNFINSIVAASVVSTSAFIGIESHAGTLGPCPNRGDRCYLEMNGKFNYQADEEPYFPGGWKDAARWCGSKGGQYINSLSGPDYCSF